MKASVAHRAIAAKCQVHEVGSALNLLRKFTVLETANQMSAAVWAIVDVQEVIVGLDTEAGRSERNTEIRFLQISFCYVVTTRLYRLGVKMRMLCDVSVQHSARSESYQPICFASPDKETKKKSPQRGEKRLNCCDTVLAQNLPRRQWQCSVRRLFHIVALYIESHAAVRWEGAAFALENNEQGLWQKCK